MFDIQNFRKLKRGPQVILFKDASFVTCYSGLQSGDVVVDVGTGSGFLSIYLGLIVAPEGKVFTFEKREEFARIAEQNIKKMNLEKIITLVKGDALRKKWPECNLVTIDAAGGEALLEKAFKKLKPGGVAVGFLPNVEQMKTFVMTGEKLGFKNFKNTEVFDRNWLVREQGCRPENTGLIHSVFLSFLRKPF